MTADELIEGTDIRKTTAQEVIRELWAEGILRRTGTGKRNSAFRYFHSNAYRDGVAIESNEGPDHVTTDDSIHSNATSSLYTEESKVVEITPDGTDDGKRKRVKV